MTEKEMIMREIDRAFEEAEKLEVGTEQYDTTMNCITKLYGRLNEIEKAERETEFKQEQAKLDRKDQKIKHGIDIAGVVLPLAVTIWGTLKSLEFEKEGTVTTIMGRAFINKLLKK